MNQQLNEPKVIKYKSQLEINEARKIESLGRARAFHSKIENLLKGEDKQKKALVK